MSERGRTRVGIAGLGAVGRELAARLAGGIDGLKLTVVSAKDHAKARRTLTRLGIDVPVVAPGELEPLSDTVVECAPASVLPTIAEPVLRAGKEIVVLSAGALLQRPDLIRLAAEHGARISIPTGALIGLDAVRAAAEAEIYSVRMISRKPPGGLAGAPHLGRSGIDPASITEPVMVFSGSAREAAEGFPANLNVAAALALAGIGPDRTQVEVWIDPTLTRNVHDIEVRAEAADFRMHIENAPSENPRTGRITALSVISLLRRRHVAVSVGS